jgi:lipoprotein-anchoring transpeptidase ErfK/SrfK
MAAVKKWIIASVLAVGIIGSFFIARNRSLAKQSEEFASQFKAAEMHLSEGRASEAEDLLRDLATKKKEDTGILVLWAQSLEEQDRPDEALEVWQQLKEVEPDSGYAGDITLAEARAAVRGRDFVSAQVHFEALVRDFPATPLAAAAQAGLADIAHREGNMPEARSMALAAIDEPLLDDLTREKMEDMLGKINLDMLYSRQPSPSDTLYTVQRGDYIAKIASNNDISRELLMQVNGISDPRRLSVGHRIKIPKLDLRIVVDKWTNTLTLYSNGQFFKKYKVRTGVHDYMTPTGEFSIMNKKEDPQWTRPDTGEVIAPGAPDNELGTRWMAFSGSQLGIHGTIKPETLGYYASQGCVGMSKEDVEELYNIISIGTPIEIVGKQNPDLHLDG